MQLPEPACFIRDCARFIGPTEIDGQITIVCQAFPKGIPQDILDGEDLHLEPQEGDNGLFFQPGEETRLTFLEDELADLLATAE